MLRTKRRSDHVGEELDEQGSQAEIQVDGNVSFENIPRLVGAGATMLVGGTSSIFRKGLRIAEAVQKTYDLIPA